MLLLMWGFACAFYSLFGRKEPQFATLPLAVLNMFSYAVVSAESKMVVQPIEHIPALVALR